MFLILNQHSCYMFLLENTFQIPYAYCQSASLPGTLKFQKKPRLLMLHDILEALSIYVGRKCFHWFTYLWRIHRSVSRKQLAVFGRIPLDVRYEPRALSKNRHFRFLSEALQIVHKVNVRDTAPQQTLGTPYVRQLILLKPHPCI